MRRYSFFKMPKKNTSPNGFMIFTHEWKDRNGINMNLAQATEEAGKLWQNMNDKSRRPYVERAKQNKSYSKGGREILCCTGVPLSQVQKEKEDRQNRERQTKHNIEIAIKLSIREDKFSTQSYFFLGVNYFAKTLRGGIFVPAELSIAEFSLHDGIIRTYHTLINPGVSLYGHQYDAQVHSEETHKLPIPPRAIGDTNLGRVYNDLLKFIVNEDTGEYPPVYTRSDNIGIAESILQFMKADAGTEDIKFDIYPIQYLFYIMKEAACKIGELEEPNIFLTNAFFDRDYFEYHIGLACEYHEDIDRSKYCTQSMVIRWGYMFCDYICNDVAISLVPGRHVPSQHPPKLTIITPSGSLADTNAFEDNPSGIDISSMNMFRSIKSDEKTDKMIYDNGFPPLNDVRSTKSLIKSSTTENKRAWSRNLPMPPQPSTKDFEVEDMRTEQLVKTNVNSGRGRGRGRGRLYDCVDYDHDFPQF